MHILSIVILGIAANLDNLGIGLAYGIRKIKIPLISNLIIALLSGIATLITSFAGHLLLYLFPNVLCNILGGSIVSLVGIWIIVFYFKNMNKDVMLIKAEKDQTKDITMENLRIIIKQPERADIDYSGHISIKESILLGIALSVNCLATGLGAGMTGLSIFGMTLSVVFFSLVTIFFGVYLGKRYVSYYLGDKATIIAGILLILIGIYEMLV